MGSAARRCVTACFGNQRMPAKYSLKETGNVNEAVVEVREAISLDLEDRWAHYELSCAHEQNGNFTSALEQYRVPHCAMDVLGVIVPDRRLTHRLRSKSVPQENTEITVRLYRTACHRSRNSEREMQLT